MLASVRTALLVVALIAPAGVLAQEAAPAPDEPTLAAPKALKKAKKAKDSAEQKPSGDRKAGELEGWSGDGEKSKKSSSEQKQSAQQKKGLSPREPSNDGGLPMPREREGSFSSPVTLDPSGRVGTGLKF